MRSFGSENSVFGKFISFIHCKLANNTPWMCQWAVQTCNVIISCCHSTLGGAGGELCELLSRNTMYCQAASCFLLCTRIALSLRKMCDRTWAMDAAGLKRHKHSPSRTVFMQHTSGEGRQSADNPPDTTNSTDLHNRALVSRITLIPSSFICPIPCLLSRDMRQETKH